MKKGKKTICNPRENGDWLIGFRDCDWLIGFRDFWIYEECLSKKNSSAAIGYGGYERPNSDICPDSETFLAGSDIFQVSEFEVYQVPERKL